MADYVLAVKGNHARQHFSTRQVAIANHQAAPLLVSPVLMLIQEGLDLRLKCGFQHGDHLTVGELVQRLDPAQHSLFRLHRDESAENRREPIMRRDAVTQVQELGMPGPLHAAKPGDCDKVIRPADGSSNAGTRSPRCRALPKLLIHASSHDEARAGRQFTKIAEKPLSALDQ